MIQTPLVALVAVGLWLLVRPVGDADGKAAVMLAWLSRAATMVFLVYCTALDSIGGTGLGRSLLDVARLKASGKLTSAGAAGADLVLDTLWADPWVGGVGSRVSQAGSFAVLAAAVFAAAALWRARKAPLPACVVLVAFGWQLQTSHASPHGPIAFVLLIVGAIWIRLWQRHAAISDADARRPSRRSASR
jgi:hypothetical protein